MMIQDTIFPQAIFRFYSIRSLLDTFDATEKSTKLWLAVLQRALQDYALMDGSDDPADQKEMENLMGWFMADEEDHITSFRSICGLLGIDGNHIINKLDRMCDANLRGLRKIGLGDAN